MSLRSQKGKHPEKEVSKIVTDLSVEKKQGKLNLLQQTALEGASYVQRGTKRVKK